MREPTTTTMNPLSSDFLAAAGFETFGDAELENALAEAASFVAEISTPGARPRWLTIVGKSGTGKTFLAKAVYRYVLRNAAKSVKICGENGLFAGDCIATAADRLAESWRGNFRGVSPDEERADLLFLDDLGTTADKSGFITDAFYRLLSRRMGRWTIITSNLSGEAIKAMDARLYDRMLRDGNRVAAIKNAKSFSERNYK